MNEGGRVARLEVYDALFSPSPSPSLFFPPTEKPSTSSSASDPLPPLISLDPSPPSPNSCGISLGGASLGLTIIGGTTLSPPSFPSAPAPPAPPVSSTPSDVAVRAGAAVQAAAEMGGAGESFENPPTRWPFPKLSVMDTVESERSKGRREPSPPYEEECECCLDRLGRDIWEGRISEWVWA
jgi:hypothetical protein